MELTAKEIANLCVRLQRTCLQRANQEVRKMKSVDKFSAEELSPLVILFGASYTAALADFLNAMSEASK